MIVKENTNLFLVRFGNFWSQDFICEHKKIIEKKGYVWFLKTGKKPSMSKIESVIEDGGYIIFKESKHVGNNYYIGTFSEVNNEKPLDMSYCPSYYENVKAYSEVWFKVTSIFKMDEALVDSLVISSNGHPLLEMIDRTMSSFMFVKNNKQWEVMTDG